MTEEKNHGLVTTIYVPYHLLTGLQHQYLNNKKDLLKGVINMTGSKFNIKKWFSMKNDTVEDAQQRFKRSLICVPISVIPVVLMLLIQDAKLSSFAEFLIFVVCCISVLSCFVSLSSPLGSFKAAVSAMKWFFNRPLGGALVLLYPITLIFGLCTFVYIALLPFYAPTFLTLYGVYISKKNLDAVKEREMLAYSVPEAE